MCIGKSPTVCYLDLHSYVSGGRHFSFRLAAESFCIMYGLRLPSPLRTMHMDGDCWLCHLVKLDVTHAASLDCRNVDRNCNCYLIRTEHYSSFMFNLN
uniref:Uncharacterized protein n=1 Tax=Saimiri boliviensis boliviensis TaxID=39432 RepID=A0A2K6V1U2_SAIBB